MRKAQGKWLFCSQSGSIFFFFLSSICSWSFNCGFLIPVISQGWVCDDVLAGRQTPLKHSKDLRRVCYLCPCCPWALGVLGPGCWHCCGGHPVSKATQWRAEPVQLQLVALLRRLKSEPDPGISICRSQSFFFRFFFKRKDYVIYMIFNFLYINIYIVTFKFYIFIHDSTPCAFLLHWYQWSLISVKSVKCVLVTFIGEENKALVSLTLRLFGEYPAASTQMYVILCICTNSSNTNQSQCWIFNSQNTVIQLSVFSYHLCLFVSGLEEQFWRDHFPLLCHGFPTNRKEIYVFFFTLVKC